MPDEEELPARNVNLECPTCQQFILQAIGLQCAFIRVFCPNRKCHRQCWFLFEGGEKVSEGHGDGWAAQVRVANIAHLV